MNPQHPTHSQSEHIVTVGIDVGGTSKGFHAVALKDGKYMDHWPTKNDVVEGDDAIGRLVKWCNDHNAQMIAVDAPCRWSTDGRSRPAELQLMKKGIWCFSTPMRQQTAGHLKGRYGWMLQGEALYATLEATHPLTVGEPKPGVRCCFETYPHAITWHLRGGNANARQKRTQRRSILEQAGIDLAKLTNIDLTDAALCALTAHQAANRADLKGFGDDDTGRIWVPTSMAVKLYKFRSLGDQLSFERAEQILKTGEFHCSKLWNQNDPMEGVYSYLKSDENEVEINHVFTQKNRFGICSFSGAKTLPNPTIWGYYANGLKGVAIEVEVSLPSKSIERVKYLDRPVEWEDHRADSSIDDRVRSIITSKLKVWEHEQEYRFLTPEGELKQVVGKITGVYFGDPYYSIENLDEVTDQSSWKKSYQGYRAKLKELAEQLGYPCYFSHIGRSGEKWEVTHSRVVGYF